MAERSVFVRVRVKDADQAIKELEKVGVRGEKAIARVGASTKKPTAGLVALDKAAKATRGQLTQLGTAASLLGGPLGGAAGQATLLASGIGSVGIAAVAGLAAVGALTAGYVSTTRAAAEAERAHFRIEGAMRATGNAAGVTRREIEDFAQSLSRETLASIGPAREAAASLLTFRSIAGQTFFDTLKFAQDMSASLGGDLLSRTRQLAKALEDPARGMSELREVGIKFTESQIVLAKSLVETGRVAEAQAIIIDTLGGKFKDIAELEAAGLIGKLDTLSHEWTTLMEAMGDTSGAKLATDGLTGFVRILREAVEGPSIQDLIDRNRVIEEGGIFGLPGAAFLARRRRLELEEQLADDVAAERVEKDKALAAAEEVVAQLRADALVRIAAGQNEQILNLRENRLQKIQQAEEKALARLEALRTPATDDKVDQLIAQRRLLASKQIEAATESERRAAEAAAAAETARAAAVTKANVSIVSALEFERTQIQRTDRERIVETESRKLSADATDEQVAAVKRNAAALFDERAAAVETAKAKREDIRLREEVASVERQFDPQKQFAADIKRLTGLRAAGLNAEAYNSALQEAQERANSATAATNQFAEAWKDVGSAATDALGDMISGADDAKDVLRQLANSISRIGLQHFQQPFLDSLSAPGGIFNFGGRGGGGAAAVARSAVSDVRTLPFFHQGYQRGQGTRARAVDMSMFDDAPRFHNGRFPGIGPGEQPAIINKNEIVLDERMSAAIRRGSPAAPAKAGTTIIGPLISVTGRPADNFDETTSGAVRDLEDMLRRFRG